MAGQALTPYDAGGLARIRDARLSTWLDDVDAATARARAGRAAWPPSHDFGTMPAPSVVHFITAEAVRRRTRALTDWLQVEEAETGRPALRMLDLCGVPVSEFRALDHARQSARLSGTAAPVNSAGVAIDVDIDTSASIFSPDKEIVATERPRI